MTYRYTIEIIIIIIIIIPWIAGKVWPLYRREANRNRRYRKTTWNITRTLIISTVILRYLHLTHRAVEKVEHEIRRIHNKDKSITLDLHGDLNMIGKTKQELQKQRQIQSYFFLRDFALMWLQNLHQFSNLVIIFGFTRFGTDNPFLHLPTVGG